MFHVARDHWRVASAQRRTVYSLSTALHRRSGSALITYLGPLLAVILGIVHAAIAPVIVIGDVKPNLVLIGVVLVAAYGAFLPAATVAFVAGLTANLLVSEPLGAIPFAMLLVAALITGGTRLLGRMSWIYPPLAAFAGSLVADAVGIGLGGLVADAAIGGLPVDVMLRAALLNAAICAVLLIPARAVASRYVVDEATAW